MGMEKREEGRCRNRLRSDYFQESEIERRVKREEKRKTALLPETVFPRREEEETSESVRVVVWVPVS